MTHQTLNLLQPHRTQIEYLLARRKYRFRISAWGRQAGKSTIANNELASETWNNQGHTYWFLSPTYDNAAVQYDRMLWNFRNCIGVIKRKSDADLFIEMRSDSTLWYKSGEVLENLRSETLNGVVVDEVRNQHPSLWSMVLRPMLTTTRGWGSFISTPNGFDHFYDMWSEADKLGWFKLQAPSTCNPLITEKELNDARMSMSEAQFAQEYLAEFRDLTSGKVAVNFGPHNLSSKNPFTDGPGVHPAIPVVIGLDFNVSVMAWTLLQKRIDEFHAFDEIWIENTHTQECAQILIKKLIDCHPNIRKVGVILAGDATGAANRSSSAGQSDYDIICKALDEAKIPWTNATGEANPPVIDKVNNFNAKLKDSAGQVRFTLNPYTCPMLKKDLERVVWKNGTGKAMLDQVTDKTRTHSFDSVAYPLWWLSPLKYNNLGPVLHVIRR